MAGRGFVLRQDKVTAKDVDEGVKNKWNWAWLERSCGDIILDVFIRKLPAPGKAFCLWCESVINYSASGVKALTSHAASVKHRQQTETRKSNYRLTGWFFLNRQNLFSLGSIY